MDTDIAKLAIKIDSQQARIAALELDRLGKAGSRAEKSSSDLERQWSSLTSTGRHLAQVMSVIGGAAVVVGLTKISAASIKAASDLQEVASKFRVVFQGQEAQAEQWARSLVDSYAMSTRESKLYLSSIQDLLVPMGMASDQAGKMSFQITTLAADLGSFNNLPTAQVMDDIQSALVGNYETMKKYGVVLNATNVQQEALTMGLAKTKNELTAADKAQAAYKLIVEGSKAAIGDMARTSGGYANQLKEMHARVEDMKAAFGQGLLPVMTDLLMDFNDWYKVNKDLLNQDLEKWAQLMAGSIKGIAKAAHWTLQELEKLDSWLSGKQSGSVSGAWADLQVKKIEAMRIAIDELKKSNQPGKETLIAHMEQQLSLLQATMDVFQAENSETILGLDKTAEAADNAGKSLKEMGDKAGGAGKKVVQAIKYTHQQLQEWEIQGKLIGKDMWLSYADGAEEASKRAEAAIKERNDSITADVEEMMSENDDLWGYEAQHVSQLQEQLVNDLGRIFDGYINDILHGQVDSIGDLFESLFDSIVDMFLRMVAQFSANSLVDIIFGSWASGGLTLGGAFPALTGNGGLLGAASSGSSLASGASTVAGWLGIGGQTTVAPYVAGAGVPLGTIGGGAGTAALADFSIDAAGGTAGLASGSGGVGMLGSVSSMLGPAAMAGIGAAAVYEVFRGFFGEKSHYDTYQTSSGDQISVRDAGLGMEGNITQMLDASVQSFENLGSAAGDMEIEIDRSAETAMDMIDVMAQAGDGYAQMALQLDNTTSTTDRYLDALSGQDISMQETEKALRLASLAASGSAVDVGMLRDYLVSLGVSTAEASKATMAMIHAANEFSNTDLDLSATATLDVMVRGDAEASASVSATAETLYPAHPDIFGTGEDDGWGPNITESQYLPHASGGVFERPVAIGSHLFGEAGPEILAPLPGGAGAFAEMAREIKLLVSKVGGGSQPITIVLQNNVAGRKVEEVIIPVIDKHIDNRERAGVSGRVAYAVG